METGYEIFKKTYKYTIDDIFSDFLSNYDHYKFKKSNDAIVKIEIDTKYVDHGDILKKINEFLLNGEKWPLYKVSYELSPKIIVFSLNLK
jgi:hypothetical protein